MSLFEDTLVLTIDSGVVKPNRNTSTMKDVTFVSFFYPNIDLTLPEKEGFVLSVLKIAFDKVFAVYYKEDEYIMIVSNLTTYKQDIFELLTAVEEIFPISPIYVVVVYSKREVYLWNVSTEENIAFESLGDIHDSVLYHEGNILPPIILDENKVGLPYEDGYFRMYDVDADVRAASARLKMDQIKLKKIVACIPYSESQFIIVTNHYFYRVDIKTEKESPNIEKGSRYEGTIYEALPYDGDYVVLAVKFGDRYKIIIWNLFKYSQESMLCVSDKILHIAGITGEKQVALITQERYLHVIDPFSMQVVSSIDVLTNTLIAK